MAQDSDLTAQCGAADAAQDQYSRQTQAAVVGTLFVMGPVDNMGFDMRLEIIWFINVLLVLCGGCAASYESARPITSPEFASGEIRPQRIDVLPIDVQLWDDGAQDQPIASALAQFEAAATGQLEDALGDRGYTVASQIQWSGQHANAGPWGMSAADVERTADSLAGYGQALRVGGGGLIRPYLPAKLGGATDADATLYIGGWAYLGEDHATAKAVGKVVLITVVVAIVVVVIVASMGKGGKGIGSFLDGAGRAMGAGLKVAGRVVANVVRHPDGIRLVADIVSAVTHRHPQDAYGYSRPVRQPALVRPDYYAREDTPKTGRSALYLEATLIQASTGQVLWHAARQYKANALDDIETTEVFEKLLAGLPHAMPAIGKIAVAR